MGQIIQRKTGTPCYRAGGLRRWPAPACDVPSPPGPRPPYQPGGAGPRGGGVLAGAVCAPSRSAGCCYSSWRPCSLREDRDALALRPQGTPGQHRWGSPAPLADFRLGLQSVTWGRHRPTASRLKAGGDQAAGRRKPVLRAQGPAAPCDESAGRAPSFALMLAVPSAPGSASPTAVQPGSLGAGVALGRGARPAPGRVGGARRKGLLCRGAEGPRPVLCSHRFLRALRFSRWQPTLTMMF